MSWKEPVFFVVRMRDRKGWQLRLPLLGLIAGGMLVAFRFDQNFNQRLALWQAALASLGIGAFLTATLNAPNYQRDVSISSDSVSCIGIGGLSMAMGTWRLADIHSACLVRPVELGRPFGLLVLDVQGKQLALGVPEKVLMEKIASVLHKLQVPVQLAGWSPSLEQESVQVKKELTPFCTAAGRLGVRFCRTANSPSRA